MSYAVIVNKEVQGIYTRYDDAAKNSKGGIVIRSCDIEKYGYKYKGGE